MSAMGNGSERVPSGHNRKAVSELELGVLRRNATGKEQYDDKSEWAMAVRLLRSRMNGNIRNLNVSTPEIVGTLRLQFIDFRSNRSTIPHSV